MKLTRGQSLLLIVVLGIMLQGVLRSPLFDEPTEANEMKSVPVILDGTPANMLADTEEAEMTRLNTDRRPGGDNEYIVEIRQHIYDDLKRKAALWDEHGWRAQMDWVEEAVWRRWGKDRRYNDAVLVRVIARSVVIAARENRLQLGLVAAIADQESGFWPDAIGKQGEMGMMQVLPLKGRKISLYTDPLNGPSNALRDILVPHIAQHGIAGALAIYNGGPEGNKKPAARAYAKRVLALQKRTYSGGLWDTIPAPQEIKK